MAPQQVSQTQQLMYILLGLVWMEGRRMGSEVE